LQGQAVRLAVCTNKAQAPTDRLLGALGLERFFEVVVGGDAVAAKKPDAGHLHTVLERLGVPPGRAVMVGDSAHDLAAARALSMPCILVSFGYTPIPAQALGGDLVIDRFDELPSALEQLAEMAA
jgi:phosphoglycolate phosphatase